MKHLLHGTELAALRLYTDEYEPFLYKGGMLLISITALVLVACLCHPSILGHVLSWKPLRWIGTRSYGIYLWHYPVFVLSTPVQEIGNPVYWHCAVRIGATFILAELSYHFIEQPIRTAGFRPFLRRVFLNRFLEWKTSSVISRMSLGLILAAILVFAGGLSGIAEEKTAAMDVRAK